MTNHVLLNNIQHKDLKVVAQYAEEYGDNVMCVPVYPVEFRHLQAHYPILFIKDPNGDYQVVSLFGFTKGENLFLEGGNWRASYVPLLIEKGPFLIGRNQREGDETLSIHVDMDHPKVNTTQGHAVFLPHGGNSDYIENVSNILSTIHQSQAEAAKYIQTLEQLELIETFVVDIELDGTGTHRLSGFSTLNEEKIQALGADNLSELHKSGYLELMYMQIASLSQLRQMVEYKKARQANEKN